MAHRQRIPPYLFARDEGDRRFILHLYAPEFIAELNDAGEIIDHVMLDREDFDRAADGQPQRTMEEIQRHLDRALEWYRANVEKMRGKRS